MHGTGQGASLLGIFRKGKKEGQEPSGEIRRAAYISRTGNAGETLHIHGTGKLIVRHREADGGYACGAQLVRAAIEAASVNVYVNTSTLADRSQARRIESTCEELVEEYVPRAERLARDIVSGIRNRGA